MLKNITYKLIISSALVVAVLLVARTDVYADDHCEDNYGGGENCVYNKRFRIEKEVRLEGDDSWRDKVTIDLTDGDENDKYIEFRIKIKNLSDDEADKYIDFDNMEMKDKLPDVFDKIKGDLSVDWDDFEPGDEKEFKIRVELDEDEIDRNGDYEKCAVNKASVYWDDEFEGSDTATVCWTNEGEVLGLPDTGAVANLAIAGFGLLTTGALLKGSKKYRKL
jgi:hypothetical protein